MSNHKKLFRNLIITKIRKNFNFLRKIKNNEIVIKIKEIIIQYYIQKSDYFILDLHLPQFIFYSRTKINFVIENLVLRIKSSENRQ